MESSLVSLQRKRLNKWLKEIGKYSRLILNDHFSIILFVILGFGIFFYRDQLIKLQTVVQTPWLGQVFKGLLTFLVTGLFLIGKPLWLTEFADQSFLFAKGSEWRTYWLKGSRYTALSQVLLLAVCMLVLTPLLQVINHWTLQEVGLFTLSILSLRIGYEGLRYLMIFYKEQRVQWTTLFFIGLLAFSYLSMQLSFNYLLIVALLYVGLVFGIGIKLKKESQTKAMDFNYVIESENKRRSHFYRFISIFADTPYQTASVKPRPWLTPIIEQITYFNRSSLSYLYLRLLMRNTTYSSLWLRLLIFTSVLMIASQGTPWMIIVLGGVSFVLTALQLMPLMNEYRHYPSLQLQLKSTKERLKDFQPVLGVALLMQLVVFIIIAIVVLPLDRWIAISLGSWIGLIFILVYFYSPYWAKKHNE